MKSKGLIPTDCIYAGTVCLCVCSSVCISLISLVFFQGHSLGEYAALDSVASVMSLENLVDIVFLRGITMQNAVIRDEKGRSPYAMVAINPR